VEGLQAVTVFCGSRMGNRSAYADAARGLGVALAQAGLRLVYGGASVGLMGELADAVMSAGGSVVGVLPQSLMDRELAHPKLTELHVVDSLHTRKAMMEKLGGAFVAMPGGFGTLDELFEILTWAQLGLHTKPIGLLNTEGYFEPLIAMVERISTEGFIPHEHLGAMLVESDPALLVQRLQTHPPMRQVRKWVTRSQT